MRLLGTYKQLGNSVDQIITVEIDGFFYILFIYKYMIIDEFIGPDHSLRSWWILYISLYLFIYINN
jgi:hypothetical protein